jgi:hypothetical protein
MMPTSLIGEVYSGSQGMVIDDKPADQAPQQADANAEAATDTPAPEGAV